MIKGNGAMSGASGLYMKNCRNVLIDNAIFEHHSLGGIKLQDCRGNTISNLIMLDNQIYGYMEAGNSNYNTLMGAVFDDDNTGTRLSQIGASSRAAGVMIGSTYYTLETGAVSH